MKVIVCKLLLLFILLSISSLDMCDIKYIIGHSIHVEQKMHMDGDVVKITNLIKLYC